MASEHLIVQAYEGIVLVKITKERLLEAPVIAAIGDDLLKLTDRYPKISLVLDLADVGYLSSAFIGKLMALFKAVTLVKGRMAVTGVKPALMPLFTVTRLDKVMTFAPDAAQVINLYKRKPL
jgi:anti-anti-sigma factor